MKKIQTVLAGLLLVLVLFYFGNTLDYNIIMPGVGKSNCWKVSCIEVECHFVSWFLLIGLNCDFSVANINTYFQQRHITLHSGNTEDTVHTEYRTSSREKDQDQDKIQDQDIIKDQALRLWMDVPNDFPWRKCITDYLPGLLLTLDCHLWE